MMQLFNNVSLKPFHTFGINVFAKQFAAFSTTQQLQELIALTNTHQHLILGGGSNILFTKNFDGCILKNELKGIEIIEEKNDCIFIKVAAGEVWSDFVQYCVEKKYYGIENLSLIPGSVGASPIQNIGAYGVELKDVLHGVEAYHIYDSAFTTFNNAACEFGYRDSIFKTKYKNQFIITHVTFKLNKTANFKTGYGAIEQELANMQITTLSIDAIAQAVINIRTSKLPNPAEIGNAGSFFKNPTISVKQMQSIKIKHPNLPYYINQQNFRYCKIPAAWLIEQCGWKGYRLNDAGCHNKQALVLVNYGNATGKEIVELSESIIQSVKNSFGICLEKEVNIL